MIGKVGGKLLVYRGKGKEGIEEIKGEQLVSKIMQWQR